MELPAGPDRNVERSRAADEDESRSVVLEPKDRRPRAKNAIDLLAYRREDLGRRYALRDQSRDAPQRRLLIGEPREGVTRFGVRNCGPDEFRELGETGVRPFGDRLRIGRDRDDHAPQKPLDS